MRYDKGPLGALMDEYERALNEYIDIVTQLPSERYEAILDPLTQDNDCRSVQSISSHVLWCGYGYADAVREAFGISKKGPVEFVPHQSQIRSALTQMFDYTDETLQDLYALPYQEVGATPIPGHYEVEALFEHAIVHVLRHRRQVERLIAQSE